jgi:hypothetical protein
MTHMWLHSSWPAEIVLVRMSFILD